MVKRLEIVKILGDMAAAVKKSIKKRHQVRVSFNEEDEASLQKVVAMFPGLEENEVVRMMVAAFLKEAREKGYKLNLPLEFLIKG